MSTNSSPILLDALILGADVALLGSFIAVYHQVIIITRLPSQVAFRLRRPDQLQVYPSKL